MPFVQRDTGGNIVGTYAQPQPGYAEEFLADDAPGIIAMNEAIALEIARQRLRAARRARMLDLLLDSDQTLDQVRAEARIATATRNE